MYVHRINSVSNFKENLKSSKKEKEIKYKNLAILSAGLSVASFAICMIRTSKSRFESIYIKTMTPNNRKWVKNDLRISIENLKNDKNVLSLDELSGLENIKNFINDQILLLKNSEVQNEHKVKNFNSLLLWGVPGTGKTSVAKGIAKKLDADFIMLDKEAFDSEFVSAGPRNLAILMEQIEVHAKNNPSKSIVVFMDEIDGTMPVDISRQAKHSDDLVNTLKRGITNLQENCQNIIFIGATNKDPNGLKSDNITIRLNPAVLSRFKYQIEFGLPHKNAINDAWTKLVKTAGGKDKFTDSQNEAIAEKFYELKMSFRDLNNIADKLNRQDAIEYCKKGSYNSKENLINVLLSDEKIGYDPIKKETIQREKIITIVNELKKKMG